MTRTKTTAVCLVGIGWAIVFGAAVSNLGAAELASRRAALNTIKTDELQSHVSILADDSLEGREAGSRGGRAAAKYLVRFLSSRVKPAATQASYAQYFGHGFQNVVGLIPGSDPKLAHEYVLIGAHYDHVGYGTRENSNGPFGYVHNGADDNASGTSALLELVDAFAQLKVAPRRTIIFAFWDAEEKGLLGSEHWAAQPSVPLSQVKLAINMDMIGRLTDNRVEFLGSRTGVGFRRMASRANTEKLKLDFVWKLEDNSDHFPFLKRNVPVMMLHTGLHGDYHRPSDDAHLINHEGIRRITRLAFNLVFDAANADSLPTVRQQHKYDNESTQAQFEVGLAQPAPRLGLSWNERPLPDSDTSIQIEITTIRVRSAAARSGLQSGDRIIAVNNQPVQSSAEFRTMVAVAPVESQFEIARDNDEQTIDVRLDGQPVRLGISWRQNDAELGTVAIVRVVRGSAAERAGLQLLDRIWAVNGESFRDTGHFQQMIRDAVESDSIELTVERDGVVSDFQVTLW